MTGRYASLLGALVGIGLLAAAPRPALGQGAGPADSVGIISRGTELYSRNCQRCHNPRGAGEWNDREWVMIMQHMETRANLTRDRARLIQAFLVASNAAARAPGRERPGVARDTTLPEITGSMIDSGREIFHGAGACASCHGADLGGGPIAPNLKDDRWRNGEGTYRDILSVVRNGVDGTAMVPYPGGISDEMAQKVAAYVYSVSQGEAEAEPR